MRRKGTRVGTKGAGVTCPACHGYKDTRQVPLERGLDPMLMHFVCDRCEIGWYELPGKRSKRVLGGGEAAKKAYVAEGKPKK